MGGTPGRLKKGGYEMASLKYWMWLSSLKGLSGQTRLTLLRRFGDPENIYYAEAEELLLSEQITGQEAAILANKSLKTAESIWASCREANIRILTIQDGEYPGRLKNIYDPR